MLPLLLQHVVEDHLAEQLGLLAAAEFDRLDLLVDVPLFVGQEEVVVAVAADERLLLQPAEALLDPAPQGQPVGVDLVEAEGHEVVDVPLDLLHVADQEENLEQLDVERLQAGVVSAWSMVFLTAVSRKLSMDG